MDKEKKIDTILKNLLGIGLKEDAKEDVLAVLKNSSEYELADVAEIIAEHIRFRKEGLTNLKNRIHRLTINYEERMDRTIEGVA